MSVVASKSLRFGSWYVAEHRLRLMRAYLQTVIATSIGSPLVYLFALGVGLASLVEQDIPVGDGRFVGYLAFVAPALLATSATTVAVEEGTYPVMAGFKWNPTFHAMHASPISPAQIVNGVVIAIFARILFTVGVYYVFMLLFDAMPSPLGAVNILTASLTGMAIGLVVIAYITTIRDYREQPDLIMRFLVTPMFLFSGTFFPLEQLPVFLQWLGWISPLWHGAELGRVFGYGLVEPLWLTLVHFGYLATLGLVGWRLAQRFMARTLES